MGRKGTSWIVAGFMLASMLTALSDAGLETGALGAESATLVHRRPSDVINEIGGVRLAPNGTLYFCDVGNTIINRIFRLVGDAEEVIYTRPKPTIHDIAFSPDGTLYFADSTNKVYKLIGSAEEVAHESQIWGILAIAFHPNGTMYYSTCDSPGLVYRASAASDAVIYSRTGFLGHIDFGADGSLFYTDGPMVATSNFFKAVGAQESLVYTTERETVRGMCMASNGTLYYTAFVSGAGCIYSVPIAEVNHGILLGLFSLIVGGLAHNGYGRHCIEALAPSGGRGQAWRCLWSCADPSREGRH